MVSQITVIRDRKGGTGTLTYIHNGVKIGDIKIRTGSPSQSDSSEWVRKKSGIPIGDFWLWNFKKHIQQFFDLDATGREIGRAYYVSSDRLNPHVIISSDGFHIRMEIMIHDENGIPFSLGCIVFIDNSIWRIFCKHLEDTPEGHIPVKVTWKD